MDDMMSEQDLFKSQNELGDNEMLVIKFSADWCVPCLGIKSLVEELVLTLPATVKYYEVDVAESIDLYQKLKTKRMLNGIPAILGYKGGKKDSWYTPDDSVLGGDKVQIKAFFDRCIVYGS
jgi:thiol-disulfide isomerase/thioredoxin